MKVITTFLGLGKMSLIKPLPMDRVYLLNPGQSITAGDRILTAVKPPSYDAPETTGLFDSKSGAFFSSDCFGALMAEPADDARTLRSDELQNGMVNWSRIDCPWLHMVDEDVFAGALHRIRALSPKIIFSSHLPPARDMTERILQNLAMVPNEEPFLGPDQAAMDAARLMVSGA
jgi:flavorubredoxin